MVVTYKTNKKVDTIIGKKILYKQFPDEVWKESLENAEKMFKPKLLVKVDGKFFPLKKLMR